MSTGVTTGIVELLEQGFGWTGERLARVGPGDLDAPTPCEGWRLRELVNHMLASLGRLAAAAAGEVAPPAAFDSQAQARVDRMGDDCGRAAFAAVRERALAVWQAPGVMERTCVLPLGSVPGSMAARVNLVEVVVHGWDVGQATGERPVIPDRLAGPILDFSRQAVAPRRGIAFGPDLGLGEALGERAVAFLGRTP
jgi:uncharacterized protein (TIGR03086 family)